MQTQEISLCARRRMNVDEELAFLARSRVGGSAMHRAPSFLDHAYQEYLNTQESSTSAQIRRAHYGVIISSAGRPFQS